MPDLAKDRSTHATAKSIVVEELETRARYDIENAAAEVSPLKAVSAFILVSLDGTRLYSEPPKDGRCITVYFNTWIDGVLKLEREPRPPHRQTPQEAIGALVAALKVAVAGKRLYWCAYPHIEHDINIAPASDGWHARCRLGLTEVATDG